MVWHHMLVLIETVPEQSEEEVILGEGDGDYGYSQTNAPEKENGTAGGH